MDIYLIFMEVLIVVVFIERGRERERERERERMDRHQYILEVVTRRCNQYSSQNHDRECE